MIDLTSLLSIFTNYIFLSFIITWVLAVIIKTIIKSYNMKAFEALSGLETGGMPSSHSAVVTSITVALFLEGGITSLFVVSLVIALIIISDSFMLRRNVGIQGDSINKLLQKSKYKAIHVVYGHTFIQVIAGILLGIIIPVSIFILMHI